MKSLVVSIASISLLSGFTMVNADEEKVEGSGSPFSSATEDPSNLIQEVEQRRAQRESLLPISPLKLLHDGSGKVKDYVYQASAIKLGLTVNHLFQGLSDAKPGLDTWGTTTDRRGRLHG